MSAQELFQPTKKSWRTTALNELGQLYCGQSPTSSKVNTEGKGTLYVSGPEQWDGQRIRQGKWTTEPRRLVPDGCIFITVKGAGVGKIFPGINCAIGRDVYAFKPNAGLSAKFIEHAIRFTVQDVLRHAVGDIPGLSKSHILQHEIGLPELQEQVRIVAEIEKQFSRLDEAVANLKRVKSNLKRYKASILKAAVEGKLTEDWRKQHPIVEPASKLLERILVTRRTKWSGKGKYKEPAEMDTSARSSLPDGWLWASIESLSTKVVDGVHKKPNYASGGVPFVTVRNLTERPGINLVKLNFITKEDHEQFIKRADPGEGDILISKDGTLGVVRVIRTKAIFSIFVSVALVKPVLREMSDYLGIALSSPQVQAQMVPKGSGLQHIHLEDLRADCVPVPPLDEQKEIVSEVERRLSVIEELEAAVQANLTRADRLRQSILSQAFSGKLVKPNPARMMKGY